MSMTNTVNDSAGSATEHVAARSLRLRLVELEARSSRMVLAREQGALLAAATERALFDRSEDYDLAGAWRDEVETIVVALTAAAHKRHSSTPRRAA